MKALIIAADEIKKSLPGYVPEKSESFHHESAKRADQQLQLSLKESPCKEVILMCGGAASGKTEYVSEYLVDLPVIVFDGTLPTLSGAEIKIRSILKARKTPIVCAVLPDDMRRAFAAFLHRDRKFSDTHFYRTHVGSRKTLLAIAETYPEIEIQLIESSYVYGKSMTFKKLVFHKRDQLIAFLKKQQYTEDILIDMVL